MLCINFSFPFFFFSFVYIFAGKVADFPEEFQNTGESQGNYKCLSIYLVGKCIEWLLLVFFFFFFETIYYFFSMIKLAYCLLHYLSGRAVNLTTLRDFHIKF